MTVGEMRKILEWFEDDEQLNFAGAEGPLLQVDTGPNGVQTSEGEGSVTLLLVSDGCDVAVGLL